MEELEMGTAAGAEVRETTPEEALELFDRAARRFLQISGSEFLSAWDAGEFDEDDRPEVYHVALLIPLVR